LRRELLTLAEGAHPLTQALPDSVRGLITSTLRFVVSILPDDFNLSGANVGNLVITGIFISHDRDIDAALSMVGKMVGMLGTVVPSSEVAAQLGVQLRNGELIVGQHRITGKEGPAIASPVERLFLTDSSDSPQPIEVPASRAALRQISEADLICYPYGSFYSSVLANLLPRGVGAAIVATRCPKVYVPNWGNDPEQLGMTLADTVERLLGAVRREAPEVKTRDVLQRVVLDSRHLQYALQLDVPRVEALGVEVLDLPFGRDLALNSTRQEPDFTQLAELLVSLS
jgi:CofD-related protein of GAK system